MRSLQPISPACPRPFGWLRFENGDAAIALDTWGQGQGPGTPCQGLSISIPCSATRQRPHFGANSPQSSPLLPPAPTCTHPAAVFGGCDIGKGGVAWLGVDWGSQQSWEQPTGAGRDDPMQGWSQGVLA